MLKDVKPLKTGTEKHAPWGAYLGAKGGRLRARFRVPYALPSAFTQGAKLLKSAGNAKPRCHGRTVPPSLIGSFSGLSENMTSTRGSKIILFFLLR